MTNLYIAFFRSQWNFIMRVSVLGTITDSVQDEASQTDSSSNSIARGPELVIQVKLLVSRVPWGWFQDLGPKYRALISLEGWLVVRCCGIFGWQVSTASKRIMIVPLPNIIDG